MEKFRLLEPTDIECKVKKVTDKGAILLLYKTARTDMDILDDTVGAENWDCEYSDIKGNLYCKIGIRFPEGMGDRWIYKQDCGIESREDDDGNQKKGEASDAFKRAGFKWGIGRELYTAPFIWIPADRVTIDRTGPRPRTNDTFKVDHIAYNERRQISELRIVNTKTGVVAFAHNVPLPPTKAPRKQAEPEEIFCQQCGKSLASYRDPNRHEVTPSEHAEKSRRAFGKVLCIHCIRANASAK